MTVYWKKAQVTLNTLYRRIRLIHHRDPCSQCGEFQSAQGHKTQTLRDDWDLFIAGITLGPDGVLIIDRVKKDDEGVYKCVAKNVDGIAETSASITVHGETSVTQQYLKGPTRVVLIIPATVVRPLTGCNPTQSCFMVYMTNSCCHVWKVFPDTKIWWPGMQSKFLL